MDSEQAFEPEFPPDVAEHGSPECLALLRRYFDRLLLENHELNLTAIRDRKEAWSRHIVESLRLLPWVEHPNRLLDLGSGGGVPGMVLAIARPDIRVTLLEATAKKARFLETTAAVLGLSNVSVVWDRAEAAAAHGAPLRESFDLVTARAVAPLRVLIELSVPFLRLGGVILAVKGERATEELADAERALETLRVTLRGTYRQPTATLVVLEKLAATPPRYPRKPGEPKRRPL